MTDKQPATPNQSKEPNPVQHAHFEQGLMRLLQAINLHAPDKTVEECVRYINKIHRKKC